MKIIVLIAVFGCACHAALPPEVLSELNCVTTVNTVVQIVDLRKYNTTLPLTKIGKKSYYFNLKTKANWFAAMNFCHANNMHLTNVLSEEENKAIGDYMVKNGFPETVFESVWTSGSDLARNRDWYWTWLGRPFIYSKWAPREPNNAGGKEHCVSVFLLEHKPVWNDVDCTIERNFVCEADYCTAQCSP